MGLLLDSGHNHKMSRLPQLGSEFSLKVVFKVGLLDSGHNHKISRFPQMTFDLSLKVVFKVALLLD